jgi:hypothetical protein
MSAIHPVTFSGGWDTRPMFGARAVSSRPVMSIFNGQAAVLPGRNPSGSVITHGVERVG